MFYLSAEHGKNLVAVGKAKMMPAYEFGFEAVERNGHVAAMKCTNPRELEEANHVKEHWRLTHVNDVVVENTADVALAVVPSGGGWSASVAACSFTFLTVGKVLKNIRKELVKAPPRAKGDRVTHSVTMENIEWVIGTVVDTDRTKLPHTYTLETSQGKPCTVLGSSMRRTIVPGRRVWHDDTLRTVTEFHPATNECTLDTGVTVPDLSVTVAFLKNDLVELTAGACANANVTPLAPASWRVLSVECSGGVQTCVVEPGAWCVDSATKVLKPITVPAESINFFFGKGEDVTRAGTRW